MYNPLVQYTQKHTIIIILKYKTNTGQHVLYIILDGPVYAKDRRLQHSKYSLCHVVTNSYSTKFINHLERFD